MQTGAYQSGAHLGDRRFVGDRRVRVGRRMGRLGRIVAERAANLVQRFGAAVPRLHLRIGERPARRRAARMLDGIEVLRPISGQNGAIKLGGASDVIVGAGIEWRAGAVDPRLVRTIDAALENRARVSRVRTVGENLAALENDDARARRREPGRQRRAAHAGADNDDVSGFHVGHAVRS